MFIESERGRTMGRRRGREMKRRDRLKECIAVVVVAAVKESVAMVFR